MLRITLYAAVPTLCALVCNHAVYSHRLMEFLKPCQAERREPWSYRGLNGPLFWGLSYPNCYGDKQSPIAIHSSHAVKDENLAKLTFNNYDQPITRGEIQNNGHTIEITPEDQISRTISVNGVEYSLSQFHFHWGDHYHKGSEHVLDGVRYAMEMHLVHTNADNQIAVVGIFLQESDNDNEDLQNLVDELPNVRYKNDTVELKSSIDLGKLLPSNPTSYYRYQGSLTTPGCAEGVTWSVVPEPIPVGHAQMKQFHHLYAVEEKDAKEYCNLVNNHRPLQLLLGRQVYLSQ